MTQIETKDLKTTQEKYDAFINDLHEEKIFKRKVMTKKHRVNASIVTYLMKLGFLRKRGKGFYEWIGDAPTPLLTKKIQDLINKSNKYYMKLRRANIEEKA